MRSSPSAQPVGGHAVQRRVLLVEDDPEAALFAAHVLTGQAGFEVTHTPDPAAALALAATEPWDLVLTDWDLPVMSGLQLLAALRKLAPRLPVVILTACLPDAGRTAALRAGRPDAILVKPVPAERLLATVAALATSDRASDDRGY